MKKRLLIVSLLALLAIIILPPIVAPFIHKDDSPRSAIREEILKDGHPYQSFFAIIISRDTYDEDYGHKYEVIWNDWKNETGMTGTICYAKQNENEKYSVSCGTGP